MKKLFITTLLFICSTCVTNAFEFGSQLPKLVFQIEVKKPANNGNPVPRGPLTIPDVYLDDHTLYLDSIDYDSTILLTDATDTVVYSVFVPSGTTTVVLPSTFIGTYGLSLVPNAGDYYYYSEIEL